MCDNNKEEFININDIPGISGLKSLDISALVARAIKYLVEGLAVAIAAYYIPQKKMNLQEIAMIAVTAALTFAILDMYSPSIASAARRGAGFGIGAMQVGFP